LSVSVSKLCLPFIEKRKQRQAPGNGLIPAAERASGYGRMIDIWGVQARMWIDMHLPGKISNGNF